MRKKRVLLPVEKVDVTAQKYEFQQIKGLLFLHNSMPFLYLYHGFWFHFCGVVFYALQLQLHT